jgi:pimeloyl-ACP methyl ester carboxylesterase
LIHQDERNVKAVLICAVLACTSSCASSTTAASPCSPSARPIELRSFRFVDYSRSIRLPNGKRVARPIETIVRYPTSNGAHPLIVFGHGFALTPAVYGALLDAWARAGFVVAAPVFPLGNAHAPGGATESDLVNQPKDMSVVISRLLGLNAQRGALGGRIDASRIAVAGHSDGAETALAVAYDRRYRDPRVRAAIVLSGAALPGMGPFARRGPPLLAVQGTADPINPPGATAAYFRLARRPKFLLWLLGAAHLPPYTDERPQLDVVEHATLAFLGHYLEGAPLRGFITAARRPGITRLVADP